MIEPLVTGEIILPSPSPDLSNATVYVRLQETTQADALARTITEEVLTQARERTTSGILPFTLCGEGIDPRARYTISVHIDVNGDGAVSRGDYIHAASIPVLTYGHPNRVHVLLQVVA